MKKRYRIWLVGAILILGTFVGYIFTAGKPSQNPPNTVAAAPNVQTAIARQGDFIEKITVQGRIGPPAGSSAKLTFPQAGIVHAVVVEVGQTVHAGQALVELERQTLLTALEQAQADARIAQANYGHGAIPQAALKNAQAKLNVATVRLRTLQLGGEAVLSNRIAAQSAARQAAIKVSSDLAALSRAQTLFNAGVVAGKDLQAAQAQLAADRADERAAQAKVAASGTELQNTTDQARADVASATNEVRLSEAQAQVLEGQAAGAAARLDAARIAYENGVLIAPSDGVVLAIFKHPGEAIDPTSPAIEVGPQNADKVTLNVPADMARRIRVGDSARLQIPQTREQTYPSKVIAVVPAADPTTQTAMVVLSGAPSDALAGDAVTADIVVARITGVLLPSNAIIQDPQTGRMLVFVLKDHPKNGESAYAMRQIRVRASDSVTAAVQGVLPGERIAARGGYELLTPSGG